MSFERGPINLRVMASGAALPPHWLDCVNQQPFVCGNSGTPSSGMSGWCGPRYLGDLDVSQCDRKPWVHLMRVRAARAIPVGLLKHELAQEELAEMAARGVARLNAKARADVRRRVVERLQPEMPLNYKAIEFATAITPLTSPIFSGGPAEDAINDKAPSWLFRPVLTSAVGDSEADAGSKAWFQTFGERLHVVDFTTLMVALGVMTANLKASRFAPGPAETMFVESIGADFLTWLWYRSEMALPIGTHGDAEALIEGPLVFKHDGAGSFSTTVARGDVLAAGETKAALLAGKKLVRARLSLAVGGEAFAATIDDGFALRSVKLPRATTCRTMSAGEALNARATAICRMYFALVHSFVAFLSLRRSDERWESERDGIQTWIEIRRTAG
jgi:hypothetical protein